MSTVAINEMLSENKKLRILDLSHTKGINLRYLRIGLKSNASLLCLKLGSVWVYGLADDKINDEAGVHLGAILEENAVFAALNLSFIFCNL